jgi:predicted nucleic acid-binding protein
MLSVFLDANVIYSITLTDVLLTLAEHDLFLPLWTPNVLQEAHEAASRTLPDAAQQAFRERLIMMDQAFPESSIHVEESEWSQFDLPDPDDRHVLAAAAQGQADALATRNIKDFPQKLLDSCSIQVITPDDLLCVLLRRNRKPQLAPYVSLSILDIGHR